MGTASAQSADDLKVDWAAYIDSIARQNPEPWMAKANQWHLYAGYDSSSQSMQGFIPGNVQLSDADWTAYQLGKRQGRIAHEVAARIFQQEDLPFPQDGSDSVSIEVLNGVKADSKLDAVMLSSDGLSWEATVIFLANGCYLGKSVFFHKYGVSGGGGVVNGIPVVWHIVNLESGTGVWEFELQVYGLIHDKVVQMGWVPQEINLTNPCIFNRHLTSKVVKTSPLTVSYEWDVDLGLRYRGNSPSLKGKAVVRYDWDAELGRLVQVFLSGNLNAEKLLSLSLSAPNELLIHAFATDLKALLRKKGRAHDEVVEFLKETRAGGDEGY